MQEEKKAEDVALFDMDGTLCDYDIGLFAELEKLKSPEEESVKSLHDKHVPEYVMNRANLIREKESWWENLPKLKLGWDILEIVKYAGFKIMILTQGPKKNPSSWSGKMRWISKNLPGVDVTITRDKGLVYGKILVDDYPEYILRWLEYRPRGLVIMPRNNHNKDFKHSNVIAYDGTNLEEVKRAIINVKNRKARESLEI